MKAVILSTPRGICGATPADETAFRKFKARILKLKSKPGEWLRIEFSSPRNGPQHRKLFALLNLIAENSDELDTTEKALYALKLVLGHCDPMVNPSTGEIVPFPRSISYENLEQDDFDKFYAEAMDAVSQHLVKHLRPADRDRVLEEIILGWA